MRDLTSKIIMIFIICFVATSVNAQNSAKSSDDFLKETIYTKHKQEVLNYSLKDFDVLFLDFLAKQNNPKVTLTKEQFYNYTMKIAIFSERQAKLFKSKKAEAQANTEDWKSRTYEDYLAQKTNKK
jgi:hypothetical protein